MEKGKSPEQSQFVYDEEGTNETSAQIMNAYNSGVVGHPNGNYEQDEKVNEELS